MLICLLHDTLFLLETSNFSEPCVHLYETDHTTGELESTIISHVCMYADILS